MVYDIFHDKSALLFGVEQTFTDHVNYLGSDEYLHTSRPVNSMKTYNNNCFNVVYGIMN